MGTGDVAAPRAVFCDLSPDAVLNQDVRELLAGLGFDPVAFSGAHVPSAPHSSLDRDYGDALGTARLLIFWFPAGRTNLDWVRYVMDGSWLGFQRDGSPPVTVLAYVEANGTDPADVEAATKTTPTIVADKNDLLQRLAQDVRKLELD